MLPSGANNCTGNERFVRDLCPRTR